MPSPSRRRRLTRLMCARRRWCERWAAATTRGAGWQPLDAEYGFVWGPALERHVCIRCIHPHSAVFTVFLSPLSPRGALNVLID